MEEVDMENILTSTKKLLNLSEEQTDFDPDIIVHINRAFSRLRKLGVGPAEGFSISDVTAMWDDYMDDDPNLPDVKTYVYLKTKIVFDPPLSSTVLASMKEEIKELEWTLNVDAENADLDAED